MTSQPQNAGTPAQPERPAGERTHDSLAGLPDYAGSADPGLRDSLPADDPALGDVAEFVGAEHRKLLDLLGTMVALRDAEKQSELDMRWYGVVRELLEFGTALERVVWPELRDAEAADGNLAAQHRAHQELLDRLRGQDEALDRSADPDVVVDLANAAARQISDAGKVLVPALARLPEDERLRLGEDMRQVMG